MGGQGSGPQKRPVGRPCKLTHELQERIVESLRAGNYLEPSAARAGVHKSSVYSWFKRGAAERERLTKNPRARMRKREQPFVEFLDAVEKAEAEAEIRDVALIAKAAAEGDWKASAWRLERKNPNEWGRRMRQDVHGEVMLNQITTVDPGGPSPRELSPEEERDASEGGKAPVNAFVVPDEPNVSS